MALLKYFRHMEPSKEEKIESVLPEPDGPLAHSVPSSVTETANSVVREVLTKSSIKDFSIYVRIFVYVVSMNNRVHIESVSLQCCASVHHAIIIIIIACNRLSVSS